MEESLPTEMDPKTTSSKPGIRLNIHTLLLCFVTLAFTAMLANLIVGCLTNFTCSKFLPTPGYLGCFRSHDRVFIACCTLMSFTLPIFYTTTYINFSARFTEIRRNLFIILAIISCISLPILSLTDEVISVHVLPLEAIYRFASSTFFVSSMILLFIIMKELEVLQVSLTNNEKKWYMALKLKTFFLIFLIIFDFFQWKYAYGDLKGSIFNENMQAKIEWLILSLSLFLPPFITRFFRESTLTFFIKEDVQEPVEIELSKLDIK